MPEVLEVRSFAEFIKKYLKNKFIKNINILKGRYYRKPFEINISFPIKVDDIKTKGKFLYFILNNIYFFSTLGLAGGWCFYKNINKKFIFPKIIDIKYQKIILNNLNIAFHTDAGILYYYDTLSFGTFKIVTHHNNLIKKLNTIGEDIMNKSTTFEIFKNKITKKNNLEKVIGNVLVNQKVISGIGNYLRADILWLSKISPFRKIKDLSNKDLQNIYDSSKSVLANNLHKFYIYKCDYDIYGNKVLTDLLYEGSQKRTIYWVKERQI
jgi:formamidopyrimidine-DNA glycosylase